MFKINLATGAFAALLAIGSSRANEPGPFYNVAASELAGAPGTVIRSEPMANAPEGAKAFRVLYRSTGLKNEPIAVSGIVVVPDKSSSIPRPVVAWAHPTSGIQPHCAPSLARNVFTQQIRGLKEFLALGYVVAATDYPGLGTAGPHPYLIGESEGRAVLDSVRAARALLGVEVSERTAFWGHSQGGQAVLFAGQMAPHYAPELTIAGIAAAAPATDLAKLLDEDMGTEGGDNLAAMTFWSWSQIYGVSLTGIISPGTVPIINALAKNCLESFTDIIPRHTISQELASRLPKDSAFAAKEPWKSLIATNSTGAPPSSIPVLLAQGDKDTTVEPEVTETYMRTLCANGSDVAYLNVAGTGHIFVAKVSAPTVAKWLSDRLAGKPAASDCAR